MKKEEILHQAKIELCKLNLQAINIHNKLKLLREELDEDEENEERTAHRKLLRSLRNKEKRILWQLAARPDIYETLLTYHVDIWGTASCFGNVQVKEDFNGELDVDDLSEQIKESQKKEGHYGHLERQEVEDYLAKYSFEAGSSGGGTSGWDLGFTLDKKEADRLCKVMWNKYKTELETGVIEMTRKGNHGPFMLPEWIDWEEFAKEHNIEV